MKKVQNSQRKVVVYSIIKNILIESFQGLQRGNNLLDLRFVDMFTNFIMHTL